MRIRYIRYIIISFLFQLDIQRALEQDASIYDYDGVYDDMKHEKQEKIEEKQKDRKPKYMMVSPW